MNPTFWIFREKLVHLLIRGIWSGNGDEVKS